MFEGVIHREKLNEIWGDMESHYFPDAPSVRNSPWDFLCYLLSTTTLETFLVNALKTSTPVVSKMRQIDFQELKGRLELAVNAIDKKATEFYTLEKQKRSDGDDPFLISVSVVARLYIFYLDKFLEVAEQPEFLDKVKEAEKAFKDERFKKALDDMGAVLQPLLESDLIKEIYELHMDYFEGIYIAIFEVIDRLQKTLGQGRDRRTERAIEHIGIIVLSPIFEELDKMEAFTTTRRLYSRASDIAFSIAGEELEMFRGLVLEHWEPFRKEAHRVLKEERENSTVFLLPELRAQVQLWSNYSNQLMSSIGRKMMMKQNTF
ncbi:uncharacterized protein LOC143517215 [Brachyhypopomus gauderio]|uniref:uncharacterized protein LOC143517215 n=1 Tax=Brachyhypopomus gauderio TaxID=698409 RepID=UPI0040431891